MRKRVGEMGPAQVWEKIDAHVRQVVHTQIVFPSPTSTVWAATLCAAGEVTVGYVSQWPFVTNFSSLAIPTGCEREMSTPPLLSV